MLYYVGISVIFFIVGFVVIPLLVQLGLADPDMANNVSAECWGICATVLVLMLVIDLREYNQWRSVKDKVYERITRQLYGIFAEFTNICECTHGGGVKPNETMDEFFRRMNLTQLEELNRKIKLNKLGKKYLLKGEFASLFEAREQYLSTIEAKYFKFLDPEITRSLMEIQDNLHGLSRSIRIKKKMTWLGYTDEQFFERVSMMIHNIVKEIYKMHTSTSIEIFPLSTE